MKKILFILAILLLNVTLLFSQGFTTKSKKAIEYYNLSKQAFTKSEKIEYLNNAIKKDNKFVEAYWELSSIYLGMDEISNAIEILETLEESNLEFTDETKCHLANCYYYNGEYEKAISKINEVTDETLQKYKSLEIERYNYALELKNHPVPFHPQNLTAINTPYDDYFPSITADGMMFSTTVLVPQYDYVGNERFQEDLYVSFWKGDHWTESRPMPEPMNTPGNEGSQSFSADGRYMFFVQCNNPNNIGSCDIYYSIKRGNEWSYPMNLGEPANSSYWESNPVMSPTGDVIYFTTNRPGGLGDRDIWSVQVKINANGTLTTYNAQPLGAPINTDKSEFAPFIHADNETMYFSSNGHKGMGGNDIFISKKDKSGKWSEPINIGYPINTHGNESGFVVNGKGDKAYFASNKIEKNDKKLEIYEIDLPQNLRPNPIKPKFGRVYDANTKKPLQTKIEIFDQTTSSKYFESISDKKNGTFSALLPEKGNFGLNIEMKGYLYYTVAIDNTNDSIIVALQPMTSGSSVKLDNLYFDYDSDVILKTSYAEIERLSKFLKKNLNVNIEIVGHTDNQGKADYNMKLSERRANALMNALIKKGIDPRRLSAKGMGSTQPIDTSNTPEGHAKNRRVEIIVK